MRAPKLQFLAGFVIASALVGCTTSSTSEDESMYLTGTEEYAVRGANGVVECTNPKKVLICHIPPGNPANAHDICVGHQAVEPHQRNHGDTIGACAVTPTPDAGGGGGEVDAGGGDVDAGQIP